MFKYCTFIRKRKRNEQQSSQNTLYPLTGEVELANAFITTLIPEGQKGQPLKKGVGSQKQSKVVVMTESAFVENPKPRKNPKRVNHLKMRIIDDLKTDTISNTVKDLADSSAELTTDDSTPYTKLAEHVKSHLAQLIKPEDQPKILLWVHIAIGNVKTAVALYPSSVY